MHATRPRIVLRRGSWRWLCLACAAEALWSVPGRAYAADPVLSSTAPPELDDDKPLPTCKTDLRLSGAVYDAARPERSFALLHIGPTGQGALYRAGMSVGGYELVTIEPRGVLLRNHEGLCWLRLVGDPSARVNRPAAAPSPAHKRKAPKKKPSDVVVIGKRPR